MDRGEHVALRRRLASAGVMTCGALGVLPAPPAAAGTEAAATELSVSVAVPAATAYYGFEVETVDGETLTAHDLLLQDGGTVTLTVSAVRPGAVPVVAVGVCPGSRSGFVAFVKELEAGQQLVVTVAEPDGAVVHRETAASLDEAVRIKHCERL